MDLVVTEARIEGLQDGALQRLDAAQATVRLQALAHARALPRPQRAGE